MSIVTKTGDQGTTGLMYNRRVPKTSSRVEAYGHVDELNSAMGLARANHPSRETADRLLAIQKQLVLLMGELATSTEDQERYTKDGYEKIGASHIDFMEEWVRTLEAEGQKFRGWAMPGGTVSGASLDLARSTCRRAERACWRLHESGDITSTNVLIYLNRLADLLWLLAREAENI